MARDIMIASPGGRWLRRHRLTNCRSFGNVPWRAEFVGPGRIHLQLRLVHAEHSALFRAASAGLTGWAQVCQVTRTALRRTEKMLPTCTSSTCRVAGPPHPRQHHGLLSPATPGSRRERRADLADAVDRFPARNRSSPHQFRFPLSKDRTMATKNRWLAPSSAAILSLLARPARPTSRSSQVMSCRSSKARCNGTFRRHARQSARTDDSRHRRGMAFDANGYLFVTRWCIDPLCGTGNAVEMWRPARPVLGIGRPGSTAIHMRSYSTRRSVVCRTSRVQSIDSQIRRSSTSRPSSWSTKTTVSVLDDVALNNAIALISMVRT